MNKRSNSVSKRFRRRVSLSNHNDSLAKPFNRTVQKIAPVQSSRKKFTSTQKFTSVDSQQLCESMKTQQILDKIEARNGIPNQKWVDELQATTSQINFTGQAHYYATPQILINSNTQSIQGQKGINKSLNKRTLKDFVIRKDSSNNATTSLEEQMQKDPQKVSVTQLKEQEEKRGEGAIYDMEQMREPIMTKMHEIWQEQHGKIHLLVPRLIKEFKQKVAVTGNLNFEEDENLENLEELDDRGLPKNFVECINQTECSSELERKQLISYVRKRLTWALNGDEEHNNVIKAFTYGFRLDRARKNPESGMTQNERMKLYFERQHRRRMVYILTKKKGKSVCGHRDSVYIDKQRQIGHLNSQMSDESSTMTPNEKQYKRLYSPWKHKKAHFYSIDKEQIDYENDRRFKTFIDPRPTCHLSLTDQKLEPNLLQITFLKELVMAQQLGDSSSAAFLNPSLSKQQVGTLLSKQVDVTSFDAVEKLLDLSDSGDSEDSFDDFQIPKRDIRKEVLIKNERIKQAMEREERAKTLQKITERAQAFGSSGGSGQETELSSRVRRNILQTIREERNLNSLRAKLSKDSERLYQIKHELNPDRVQELYQRKFVYKGNDGPAAADVMNMSETNQQSTSTVCRSSEMDEMCKSINERKSQKDSYYSQQMLADKQGELTVRKVKMQENQINRQQVDNEQNQKRSVEDDLFDNQILNPTQTDKSRFRYNDWRQIYLNQKNDEQLLIEQGILNSLHPSSCHSQASEIKINSNSNFSDKNSDMRQDIAIKTIQPLNNQKLQLKPNKKSRVRQNSQYLSKLKPRFEQLGCINRPQAYYQRTSSVRNRRLVKKNQNEQIQSNDTIQPSNRELNLSNTFPNHFEGLQQVVNNLDKQIFQQNDETQNSSFRISDNNLTEFDFGLTSFHKPKSLAQIKINLQSQQTRRQRPQSGYVLSKLNQQSSQCLAAFSKGFGTHTPINEPSSFQRKLSQVQSQQQRQKLIKIR